MGGVYVAAQWYRLEVACVLSQAQVGSRAIHHSRWKVAGRLDPLSTSLCCSQTTVCQLSQTSLIHTTVCHFVVLRGSTSQQTRRHCEGAFAQTRLRYCAQSGIAPCPTAVISSSKRNHARSCRTMDFIVYLIASQSQWQSASN